ncbi:MAG: sulfurtransferase TusA family protein [Leptospirillum sp.]|nr:sulfurtransferase TusA family protein [Nitrospiraceae bacterium]
MEYIESVKLDCSGLMCPMPVLKTRKQINEMAPGEILLMISTDPGSRPDMEAWTKKTGHTLLLSEERDKSFLFWIRKEKEGV